MHVYVTHLTPTAGTTILLLINAATYCGYPNDALKYVCTCSLRVNIQHMAGILRIINTAITKIKCYNSYNQYFA